LSPRTRPNGGKCDGEKVRRELETIRKQSDIGTTIRIGKEEREATKLKRRFKNAYCGEILVCGSKGATRGLAGATSGGTGG